VIDPVLELLAQAHASAEGASVLLEWDAEIPGFETVHSEALRAKTFMETPPPVLSRGIRAARGYEDHPS